MWWKIDLLTTLRKEDLGIDDSHKLEICIVLILFEIWKCLNMWSYSQEPNKSTGVFICSVWCFADECVYLDTFLIFVVKNQTHLHKFGETFMFF